MQNDLISRSALDSFFYSETSGTDEMIENAVMKYPEMEMEFSDDCRALCNDIIKMCRNVIKTEPTAYSVEKVVAELQKRADDNRICVDRLQGIEKKAKLCEWKGRAGGFETAIRVVRNGGKE